MFLIDNHLIFDWYHKPTFSGRYLNYFSQHPVCQKRGTALCLIDRVILLSHPKFYIKNISLATKILLDNNYPVDFVFNVFHERIKTLIHRNKSSIIPNNNNKTKSSFTILRNDCNGRMSVDNCDDVTEMSKHVYMAEIAKHM